MIARRAAAWLLVVVTVLATPGCDKPGWLADLEHKLDVAVPQLVGALDRLAAELPAAAARIDAVLGQRLGELDAELRDAVDGLNLVLAQNQGRLDAALTARVEDLARYATALAADVHAIALGLSTKVSASIDAILRSTRVSAQQLLAALGAQLVRIEREGDSALGDAVSQTHDTIVRLAGGGALLLALVGGALIVTLSTQRRRAAAFAAQMALVTAVAVAGAALLLAPSLRARLVPVRQIVVEHDACPGPLAAAANTLGLGAAASAADTVELLPRLAACAALAQTRGQYDAARGRLRELRQRLGVTMRCSRDQDCSAGRRCDTARGECAASCHRDADCLAGAVCHPFDGRCGQPCGACPSGGRCTQGRCEAAAAATGAPGARSPLIGGGRGVLADCLRDPACRGRLLPPRR